MSVNNLEESSALKGLSLDWFKQKDNKTRRFIYTSGFLTVLLTFVVPFVTILSGISLFLIVAATGILYGIIILMTDSLFEGLSSSFLILLLFNADIPLAASPGQIDLGVYLSDITLIIVLSVLLYWEMSEDQKKLPNGNRFYIGLLLAFFVVWTLCSTIVSNGPSQFAAALYWIRQFRIFLIFITVALLARRIGGLCSLYPILIGSTGQLIFSLAQAYNASTFGLTALGEPPENFLQKIVVGSIELHPGTYPGGFTGGSRTLAGILLLILPITVYLLIKGPRWKMVLGWVFVLATALQVQLAGSDAAWVAFLMLLGVGTIYTLNQLLSFRNEKFGLVIAYFLGIAETVFLQVRQFIETGKATLHDKVGIAGRNRTNTSATANDSGATKQGSITLVDFGTLPIRIQQYAAAIDIGFTYPLFGLGGGNFYIVAKTYGLPENILIHNVYLRQVAAVGIPGALSYFSCIILVILVTGRRAFGEGNDRILWGFLMCGIFGYCTLIFWIVEAPVLSAVFWAIAGVIVGTQNMYPPWDRRLITK